MHSGDTCIWIADIRIFNLDLFGLLTAYDRAIICGQLKLSLGIRKTFC
uniref:Uncharacterized protein n=1 Tax=Anguilla anguilla TaxID=7936 RepID=A0A0E9Q0D8_ANGAN